MKAIVVHEKGGPEKLSLEEAPEPSVGPGEVVVDVAAAGLNYIDTYHRGGLYPMDFPMTPGLEGAGTVTSVGDDVSELGVGDRVAWTSVLGSYAERHVIPAEKAIPVPDDVDDRTAAAIPLQGLTAHYLAVDTFPLASGDTCLIHAGAGGVGLLLTQIAKMRGARVITTVGTAEKVKLSENAGADQVINYSEVDFKDAVEVAVGTNGIDVVYDGVGASTFMKGLDLLRPRGTMVTFGNASGPPPEISPLILSQKGSIFLTRPTMFDYLVTRDELLGRARDLFDWVRGGQLEVRIGAEFDLAKSSDAHRALEGRETTGKVLIRP